MNTSTLAPSQKCVGCGACKNACPFEAIEMKKDREGFLKPFVDKEKCKNCNLCFSSCPVNNTKTNNKKTPDCYAVQAKNAIRMKSSSGGAFSLFAKYILSIGGFVSGVAFCDDWSTEHIIIEKEDDLYKLMGSKYIQSNTKDIYKKIKKLLDEDKFVLFSGCPCQVAGLKSYLKKEYEKLFTIDLMCHGVASEGVWQKYLKENFDVQNIKQINFRDKEKLGWTCSKCTITFNDGSYVLDDKYTRLFHDSTILQKACEDCDFSKLPRKADITLGDWWNIDEYMPEINDKQGLSLVLLNNEKAEELFKKIDFSDAKITKITLKPDYNNGYIRKGLVFDNKKRENFFKMLEMTSYNSAVSLVDEDKFDVCLLTTFYSKNYGAMLVAYAVNHIIKSLGYSCLMLSKLKTQWKNFKTKNTIPTIFAKKHYNISKQYYSEEELIELNKKCRNFVVGSDQMFSYALNLNFAFLGWVESDKNKIAFSTSFGHDKFIAPIDDIYKKQYLLDRFNHISLRETSENLCNKIFKIEAQQFIDPTLMVEKNVYENLIGNVQIKHEKPYLLTYILDLNSDKIEAIKYIAKTLNLDIINIQNLDYDYALSKELEFSKNYTPEEFLYLYKHASFVVTDSYHGTCFSVKFNKPFVSIINKRRGEVRYKMFDEMNIKHRFVESFDELKQKEIINYDVDFSTANEVIEKSAKKAITWLDEALKNNTSLNKFSIKDVYLDKKIKQLELENFYLNEKIAKMETGKELMKNIFSVEDVERINAKHKVVKIFGVKFKKKISKNTGDIK